MQVLGWTMVLLMVVAIVHNLRASQKRTDLGKRAMLIAVMVSLNLMSSLDAASTIYLVAHNHSSEMNPVMNALLDRSYLLFVVVKMAITMVASLACWHYYERTKSARTVLTLASRGYCVLMAWHCLLLSSVLL